MPKSKPPQSTIPALGIVGSVRASLDAANLCNKLANIVTFDDAYNLIYYLASKKNMCNTEGAMIAACAGLHSQGIPVSLVRLKDHFPANINNPPQNLKILSEAVESSGGLIIGSPVYFGDRTSQVEALLKYLGSNKQYPMKGKVVAFLSVGAKRNGGQETTNILGLSDCLALGANIVGNGPPTSQFGGTVVAGDKGAVLDDNFGLQTSFGSGKQVGRLSQAPSQVASKKKLKILTIYTASPSEQVLAWMRDARPDSATYQDVFLDQISLGRCLACSICPHHKGNTREYTCAQSDDMVHLHKRLIESDGVMLVGLLNSGQGLDSYQVFAERTRFMRRHDFELTHMPFSVIEFRDNMIGSNFILRTTNLSLRHNGIMIGPAFSGLMQTNRLFPGIDGLANYLEHFCTQIPRYKPVRQMHLGSMTYEAVGYGGK